MYYLTSNNILLWGSVLWLLWCYDNDINDFYFRSASLADDNCYIQVLKCDNSLVHIILNVHSTIGQQVTRTDHDPTELHFISDLLI